jgi:hypothetical protein
MRDIQTDWKRWNLAERLVAALFAILASCAVGTLLYLQT